MLGNASTQRTKPILTAHDNLYSHRATVCTYSARSAREPILIAYKMQGRVRFYCSSDAKTSYSAMRGS